MNILPLCTASISATTISPELKLLIIAALALMIWMFFKADSKGMVAFTRKFMLLLFSVVLFIPYVKIVNRAVKKICLETNFDEWLRNAMGMTKGTDWVDGFLTCLLVALYFVLISNVWTEENKKEKKPDDKNPPIRIHMSGDNKD